MANRVIPKRKPKLFLSEWLTARGLNQDQFAAKLDVTPATVSRWISGDRSPDTDTLKAIEEVLDLEPGDLNREPSQASSNVLLAGMSAEERREVLGFIGWVKTRRQ